jgi:two-component system, NarL family, sensor kinase
METWQDPVNFAIWLTVAITVVALLGISVVLLTKTYYKKLLEEQSKLAEVNIAHKQSLLRSSAIVQEHERNRIAADLHDSLIPGLNRILFIDKMEENIDQIKTLISNNITIARGISHDLSPPMLQQSSVPELIEEFIQPLLNKYAIGLHKRTYKGSDLIDIDSKLQIFRIAQEALNNILVHANANHINIMYRETSNCLSFSIYDNGKGFDTSKVKKGLGLQNIEFRTQVLQGDYRFRSVLGKGTTFVFYMKKRIIEVPKIKE